MANTRAQSSSRRGRGLPRGPQALPREQVAAHQRNRLFAAMVQAVNEQGFVATTISDLVARAGISRRSFYEHFDNKDECLLATYDEIVERLNRRLINAYSAVDEWPEQIEAFARALFEATADRPDAARLVCVEMGGAGAAGVERWYQGTEQLGSFISAGFEQSPGPGTVPDPVAKAFVGSLRKILYSRVQRGLSGKALRKELVKLAPELREWITMYYPSPPELPLRPQPKRFKPMAGGRAPGTLSPLSPSGARGLPRGEHNLPRGFVAHNQRERIFDAIANLTASKGYTSLCLEDIVAEAAVSLQTFYAHFQNKEEAFLATYEVGHARAVAVVSQAALSQTSLTEGVRVGVIALLEFLASEPSYAHIACVDILIAYPHMAGRVDEANSFYSELLGVGLVNVPSERLPPPVVGEAIVGGVFELLHDYILRGLTHRLPELADHITYIALTPFVGKRVAMKTISRK
ncbi:MAG TPA: TetR/AcrR family transcriptional regulator [Solirubrobacteraceae bacterium]|nr:TetR/AcrR family transcriptional regulator [Solirubrobacteraceae bacterium]